MPVPQCCTSAATIATCSGHDASGNPQFLFCGPFRETRCFKLNTLLRIVALLFIICGVVGVLSIPGYFAYVYIFEGIFCAITATLSIAVGVLIELAIHRESARIMKWGERVLLAKIVAIAIGTVVAIVLFPRVTIALWTLIVTHNTVGRGAFGGLSIPPFFINVAMYGFVYYLMWSFVAESQKPAHPDNSADGCTRQTIKGGAREDPTGTPV